MKKLEIKLLSLVLLILIFVSLNTSAEANLGYECVFNCGEDTVSVFVCSEADCKDVSNAQCRIYGNEKNKYYDDSYARCKLLSGKYAERNEEFYSCNTELDDIVCCEFGSEPTHTCIKRSECEARTEYMVATEDYCGGCESVCETTIPVVGSAFGDSTGLWVSSMSLFMGLVVGMSFFMIVFMRRFKIRKTV